MDLKGTRTEANLRSAFAGETQARSKYDYFAKAAEKEGFQQIAAIFRETADNEEAHAFLWFSQLGALSNTAQNLVNAQSGEHFEWAEMYEDFARVAEEEGFTDIANKFRQVGAVGKPTRNASCGCCTPWKCRKYLKRPMKSCGSAGTAVTSSSERKHRIIAPSAAIRNHTSSRSPRTTDGKTPVRNAPELELVEKVSFAREAGI